MDNGGGAIKQIVSSWGSGIRKSINNRRRSTQTTMSPWNHNSRGMSIDKSSIHGSKNSLHGNSNARFNNSEPCVHELEEVKVKKPQHELAAAEPRRKRATGKLEPIKSYLRLSNVDPRHSRILPRLDPGVEYAMGNLTVSKSATYQVESNGEKFEGFQHLFLDDKLGKNFQQSFYEDTAKPLVGEFVHRQRNVCVILHGAEGSGRRRALFGNALGQNTGNASRRSSLRSSQSFGSSHGLVTATEIDDLSSLGCDGVSDVNNSASLIVDRRVSAPPAEVSFIKGSSCCSRLSETDASKKTLEITIDEEDGIIPRMLAETFKDLNQQFPSFSVASGKKDRPQLIPKNKSTSRCRLQTLSNFLTDDSPNTSVEFYNGENDIKSKSLPNITDGVDEGVLSLRISCIEIVDDLASGKCSLNDLLDYYKVPDDDVFISFGEFGEPLTSLLSVDNIRHDDTTGIVFIEDAIEMQCQSYAAAMECLTMAEEARQTRAASLDETMFTDKLYHTVYLLSLQHQDERTKGTTISHQIVVARLDESMSNSASLALHSSYLALSKMIEDVATNCSMAAANRQNALTKLLRETIGGECCTIAIGTVNSEKDNDPLPTLRLGQAISWMYNSSDKALNIDPPKIDTTDRSVKSRNFKHSKTGNNDFALTINSFDGPKRLSQNSKGDRKSEEEAAAANNCQSMGDVIHVTKPTFAPIKKFLDDNSSGRRRVSKSSLDDSLARSLDSGSYRSHGGSDATEHRNSFLSGVLAESENPYAKRYAAELSKSISSRESFEALFQTANQDSLHDLSHNPVEDAKFYLSEIEAMDNKFDAINVADPKKNTFDPQSNWRDESNEIECNIKNTRQKMMDRMKEQSARKPSQYAYDMTPEPPFEENDNRFPPEYVSIEISSHASSERYQLEINEMQQTHALVVADMQRALKALQAEKDELLKEKNDNIYELQRAKENIIRLKTGHELSSSGQCKAGSTVSRRASLSSQSKSKVPSAKSSSKVSGTTPVRVSLRVRPLNKLERHHRRGHCCIDVRSDSNCCKVKSPFNEDDESKYNFDKVFGNDSSQEDIYSCTAEVCLPKFLAGISCWVLLYGLGSSGKSYTLGTSPQIPSQAEQNDEGIIPRFTHALFREMNRSDEVNTFTLKCSVLGLHLEQFFDLLNPQTRHAPFLRESPEGIQILGATEAYCFDKAEVMSLVQRGHACRDSLSSNMNLDLRYFHTFVIFTLDQFNSESGERSSSKMWFANISACHSVEGTSKKTEARVFQRSSSILLSFVDSLNKGSAPNDCSASNLSYLLKDAFTGNSFTTSLISASPSPLTISDTVKALEFGKKMQRINKTKEYRHFKSLGNEMSIEELKTKYMSAQSEALAWRQLADSLTKKTLQMEQALGKERQKVEGLIVEKQVLQSQADTNNLDSNTLGDPLFIFDEDNDDCEGQDVVDSSTKYRSENDSIKSNTRKSRDFFDNRARHKNSSAFITSMSVSTGAASALAAEIEAAEDVPTGPVGLTDVDAFYFLSEIESSYPKMNVLRGSQPVKASNATLEELLHLQSQLLPRKGPKTAPED